MFPALCCFDIAGRPDWLGRLFDTLPTPARIAFRVVELDGYDSSSDCGVRRNNRRAARKH